MDCPFILTFGIKAPKTDEEEKSSERIYTYRLVRWTSPSNLEIQSRDRFNRHSTVPI
jgi:hypothetical protein